MKIYEATYRGLNSIILENKYLLITILPDHGGKISSIFDKRVNRELLWQNNAESYCISHYGDDFTTGDMSGFDEIFPSISKCNYQKSPWQNIDIPDHGEIWALDWQYKKNSDDVVLWTYGVRFPYRINKKVMLNRNCISIEYSLENHCQFDFDFIWAAHPLFAGKEGMEIILPSDVKSVMNIYEASRKLGEFGRILNWPKTQDINNHIVDLSKLPAEKTCDCKKLYTYGKMKKGWGVIYDRINHYAIEMSFPEDSVPYMGIWIDANGFPQKPQYNIALEPSTGAHDGLDVAQNNQSCATIKARSNYCWWLNIKIGSIATIDRNNCNVVFECDKEYMKESD